jgi:hypothetical protein
MPSLKKSLQLVSNMGSRYVKFRLLHEVKVRAGIHKRKFPQEPAFTSYISLDEWRRSSGNFFIDGRLNIQQDLFPSEELEQEFKKLEKGQFEFFYSTTFDLGPDYDWVTNPDTGHKYNASTHWTQVNDYSKEAGDIKYVWEKSRFSFIYTIIRQDARTGEDHAGRIWSEILSWLVANPINCGPNYKCSQEISLRVLNWTFALQFYKHSPSLSDEIFQKIMFAIYWQLDHVYHNIDFSRIAVRNNHAITETLTLYLSGLLYPFFPNAQTWKAKGKRWFEEEIAYQIYPDGTFLQFSMNYQRVVVQLLTWGIHLANINEEQFADVVYERASKCLLFLTSCIDTESGWLPNYGANDGALFFKLSDAHYRDFRPQLEALSCVLNFDWGQGTFEDVVWYGLTKPAKAPVLEVKPESSRYDVGGYYLHRQKESFTFIRCGNHRDRPSQADNLHLDIWCQGLNLLHDAGSYKYNTHEEELKYFMGTRSHNTVMLDDYDQMEKGARFIWYNWSQCENVRTEENQEYYMFEGTIKAFQHIATFIRHRRSVKVYKHKPLWEVEDKIFQKPEGVVMKQIWHTCYPEKVNFTAQLDNGNSINPTVQEGFYSSLYGKKESCSELVFATKENVIKTKIHL